MSTYTESLGLELITPGSQAGLWGNTTNNTFTLVDQAITGVTPVSFATASGTTYTLTDDNGAENEARSAVINITGSATGSNTIVVPNKQKTYLVRNDTGQTVRFQTASPTAYYDVEAGNSILIFCDGNNNVFTGIQSPSVGTLSVSGGGTGATTFTAGFVKSTGGTNALTTSATVNAATEVTGTLPVANGGTGAVSLTSGALLVGNGTGAVASLSGGVTGYVPTWNGSTWVAAAPGASGVSSFNGRTGAVTPQFSDYSSYYYSSSNPSGYITSAALSGYAQLSGTNTWSGTNAFQSMSGTVGNFGGGSNAYGSSLFANALSGQTPMVTYAGTSATNNAIVFYNTSGNAGTISTNALTTNYGTSSDYRLKEDAQPITNALVLIGQLNPVSFTWKTNGERALGFIAHEVQQVVPQAVVGTKDAVDKNGNPIYQNIDQSKLVSLLTAAIKELKAEVDALKAAK